MAVLVLAAAKVRHTPLNVFVDTTAPYNYHVMVIKLALVMTTTVPAQLTKLYIYTILPRWITGTSGL